MATETSSPIRISAVDFLNSRPLVWGLEEGHFPDRFVISRDVPSVCAQKLADGEADVGLIPSVAYQQIEGVRILPDLCIAADGEVRSVLLLSRKRDLRRIRSVAVDPASRTSVALLAVILAERYGIRPEMEAASATPHRLLEHCDAVLVIGDRALRVRRQGLVVHDLARIWKRLTGLPFVFAFWGVAKGVDLGDAARLFSMSLALGRGSLDRIVTESRRKIRLPRAELASYFQRSLAYDLGEREMEGLREFYRLARKHKLIPRNRRLAFYRDDR